MPRIGRAAPNVVAYLPLSAPLDLLGIFFKLFVFIILTSTLLFLLRSLHIHPKKSVSANPSKEVSIG
jgi:hypothetical protein